ncbi:MAG: cell division protein FtsL [Lachnospiraceae bacterium]|nr:cell division protein FtsL [Lachnospiraceae bacterium]
MGRQSQGRLDTHQRKTTYGKTNGAKVSRKPDTYVQGNTVRRLNEEEYIRELPRKKLSDTARKNREKAFHMNLGYVLFLSAALVAAGFILIGYIQMQYEITSSVKNISRLESQLNNLRLDNDEEYNRVLASVDLEEIKKIAMNELGMKYANQGQIVVVDGEESDYVRQYADLPKYKKK